MARKLIIETQANTESIDKAVQKLGELKDLGKGIKIQYDVDNKPLQVLVDNTLNASQKVKILTAELRKTKEGTVEFGLLNSKLKESQDDLTRINAKSRDLFASFSLIPGPIGEIFGKLNGVIGLLKTFSGFTVKDFGNQFKEFGKDITGIYDAIFGLNKGIEETTSNLNTNTEAETENADAIDESTTATNAGTAANLKQTETISALNTVGGKYFEIVKTNGMATLGWRDDIKDTTVTLQKLSEEEIRAANIESKSIKQKFENNQTTEAFKKAKEGEKFILNETTGELEVYRKGLVVTDVAAKAVVATTNALKIALKALGIGLIISAITILADKLFGWVKSLYAVTSAQTVLNESLKKGNEAAEIAKNQVIEVGIAFEQAAKGAITKKQALELYNEILGGTIGQAKTLEEAEKLYKDNTGNYIKATGLRAEAQELFALAAKQSAEALTATEKGFFSFDRGLFQSRGTANLFDKLIGRKGELEGRVDEFNKNADIFRDRAIQLTADALALRSKFPGKPDEKKPETKTPDVKKAVLDTKAANDLLLKLQQENSVNRLNEERKRQDAQLKIDKQNEEAQIQKLFELEDKKIKLTVAQEELKSKLLEQVKYKYGLKVIELNQKRQDEDNKSFDESQNKIKEYNDKVFEIMNAADESEIGRNKATLERKYADDVAALQKDAEFQKQSLEEKIRIILLLEKAKNQAIQKLDDDDAQDKRDKNLKRLDDELRLLDIKNKALIEGTKTYFNNQRAILKAANEKELADLADRAIKEKLTAIQIANEKEVINKAYLASLKDIATQELQVLAQQVQASLGVIQTALSDFSKVAQLAQQVDSEQAKKRYIAQNELDKKQATSKEQLEAKLLANKKAFAKEEDELKRKAFNENKKIQIAQAVIATLQSAVGAFSSLAPIPVVGPFLAAAAAASALVFGYRQVDLIRKTEYQSPLALSESESSEGTAKYNPGRNYAKGGMIGGRRHAEGGTLIEAEKGEAIMTRGAVASFGPLLSLMNQAGGGTSFNSNLTTTRQDNPIISNPTQEQSPLIVKTYVVSQELTTEAQRQARLKNLSTI
jgi:hypothetical protein